MASAALPGLWQTRTARAPSSTECTPVQVSAYLAALLTGSQQSAEQMGEHHLQGFLLCSLPFS